MCHGGRRAFVFTSSIKTLESLICSTQTQMVMHIRLMWVSCFPSEVSCRSSEPQTGLTRARDARTSSGPADSLHIPSLFSFLLLLLRLNSPATCLRASPMFPEKFLILLEYVSNCCPIGIVSSSLALYLASTNSLSNIRFVRSREPLYISLAATWFVYVLGEILVAADVLAGKKTW